ncbi:adenylate/guanylate cyclase domain-containing protein [Georgenia yuyongxinii]|uniref:Adenylate/guanylate cyclase domain-containing protein n=1 Tax=Georgenia yuyongxinii TaxID=2589797 RepID=A0A552WT30_9MICO|nr:adenylate/guanylate cyclase domain-containing protein [Georgenia yuyongxinii]TRW45769.1 adenylate/guanylate cyclase domain-containing protein [Georgenia yuyongxinii]
MRPEVRYARSGDLYIAYQVLGAGERDIVHSLGGPTNLEAVWDVPELAQMLEQLAHRFRVIVYDKRGAGLSDRSGEAVTVEERAADVVAVMDAAGSEHAVLIGSFDGAAASLVAAALFPGRAHSVAVTEIMAASTADEEHPWGFPAEFTRILSLSYLEGAWGEATILGMDGSDPGPRLMDAWRRWERMAATPSVALGFLRSMSELDLRPYLSRVRVPVLVIRPEEDFVVPLEAARWLVDHLPDARLVEVPGAHIASVLPGGPVLDEIEDFIGGTRTAGAAARRLRVVLVTDLVGSTALLERLGEDGWRRMLGAHRDVVRAALARYSGTEIDTAGDGFLATFHLPSQAIRCAAEIRDVSRGQGIAVRQGLHAGEVTLVSDGIAGITVHAAARVAAHAGAGEVLLSDSVLALVPRDHPPCEPVGMRTLKGIPGRWRLHRLVPASA